jgi:Domain of unknown function (DUF1707)
MSDTPGNLSTAEMRASDADRDAVLSDLSEHFQAGRLTAAEFEERAGRALAARTWGELKDLLRDLPATWPGPQAPAAATSAAARPERPERRSGRWMPAPIIVPVGIAIAVAMAISIAHGSRGFLWLVAIGLFMARRLTRHCGPPGRCGSGD